MSPCFQELILPPVLLIAALFLAWFGLGKCQPGGNKAAGSRLSHNLYLVASGAVALGHAALTGTGLASLMACISGDEPCTPLSSLLASGQLCAAWLLAMVVTLRIPGRYPSPTLAALTYSITSAPRIPSSLSTPSQLLSPM